MSTRQQGAAVSVLACPIHSSLGVLGRKWTLQILRNLTWQGPQRYSDLLRGLEGATGRMLSRRLGELVSEGFIEKVESSGETTYRLTQVGQDAEPVLRAFMNFGTKHYAREVFSDGVPRQGSDYERMIAESMAAAGGMASPGAPG